MTYFDGLPKDEPRATIKKKYGIQIASPHYETYEKKKVGNCLKKKKK
jgi:hypothetical protein